MSQEQSTAEFVLYSTDACHLCETAEEMLDALKPAFPGLCYAVVDISASDALIERYGVRIPVLRHPDGRELDWPFQWDNLAVFVGASG